LAGHYAESAGRGNLPARKEFQAPNGTVTALVKRAAHDRLQAHIGEMEGKKETLPEGVIFGRVSNIGKLSQVSADNPMT